MCRHLLIRVNSKEIFQFLRVQFNNLWIFKKFCNVYFIKPLEDDRIPTDIDINERFEVNESLWFLCKKRFLYLGTTVKLWTYWVHFAMKCFSFILLLMKKTTLLKNLSIYFGHHSLEILNSFLNILNEYNVLILIKYNLE